jgi:hypothetical protein
MVDCGNDMKRSNIYTGLDVQGRELGSSSYLDFIGVRNVYKDRQV